MSIFRGNHSKELWDSINSVKGKTGMALYLLGCRCQELEAKVQKGEAELKKMKVKLAFEKRK